jgi:membrane-associated phospholipid phosphatase
MTVTEPIIVGPGEAPLAEPDGETSLRVARFVSDVFSPPMLALPIMVMGAWKSGVPGAWHFLVLYAAIAILIPMVDLIWQLRTGRITDIHMPNRDERTRSFVLSITCGAVALVLLVHLAGPPLIVAMALATLLQGVVLFALTLRWQVSIHSAAAASFAAITLLFFGAEAALVVLIIPLVGWARLRLDRHTPTQVVVGALIGAVIALVVVGGLV